MICIDEQFLATAHTAGRRFRNGGMRERGRRGREWVSRIMTWVGGGSGRQVVGQLNECQSAVETLPLLLKAPLGSTSPLAALLLLRSIVVFPVLVVGLEKLHGVLLLLVLCSRLALWLHLGGRWGALLAGLPVPARMEAKCKPRTTRNVQHCKSGTMQKKKQQLGLGSCVWIPVYLLTLPATQPQPCCPQTGLSPGPPLVPLSSGGRKDGWDSDGWHV